MGALRRQRDEGRDSLRVKKAPASEVTKAMLPVEAKAELVAMGTLTLAPEIVPLNDGGGEPGMAPPRPLQPGSSVAKPSRTHGDRGKASTKFTRLSGVGSIGMGLGRGNMVATSSTLRSLACRESVLASRLQIVLPNAQRSLALSAGDGECNDRETVASAMVSLWFRHDDVLARVELDPRVATVRTLVIVLRQRTAHVVLEPTLATERTPSDDRVWFV
jgi:hypothetical protein